MLQNLIPVALGGAIGASLRYLTSIGLARILGAGFPYGTLTVNIVGSFLMGVIFTMLSRKGAVHLSPFLMTGILGGFTTFSAFSLDAVSLWERGDLRLAMLYVAASVFLSLGAIVAGLLLARSLT